VIDDRRARETEAMARYARMERLAGELDELARVCRVAAYRHGTNGHDGEPVERVLYLSGEIMLVLARKEG
jgi:hypothetical protein